METKVSNNTFKNKTNKLKIISGGQEGVDRVALEVARDLQIPTGGTAPQGYKTENGNDLSLKKFGLKEGPPGYKKRTMLNVDDSDGTIAIRLHDSSGTDYTIGYCQVKQWTFGQRGQSMNDGYRPVLVVSNLETTPENVQTAVDFIVSNKIRILNLAGHRESTAGIDNFTHLTTEFLKAVFQKCLEVL